MTFYLLVFFLPIGTRKVLGYFGEPAHEWNSVSVYLTDLLIAALLFFWLIHSTASKLRHLWRSERRRSVSILSILRPSGWGVEGLIDAVRGRLRWRGAAAPFFRGDRRVTLALALFLFANAASLAAHWGDGAAVPLFRLMKLAEFAALFLWIRSRGRLLNWRLALALLVAAAVLQSFWGAAQFFRQDDLGMQFLGESRLGQKFAGVAKIPIGRVNLIRSYGLFPHPNVLAAFLGTAILILGWIYVARSPQATATPAAPSGLGARSARAIGRKILVWLSLGILTFAFLLTFSRAVIGSLLIVAAAMCAWSFFHRREAGSLEIRKYVFGLFLFLGAFGILLSPLLLPRLAISKSEGAVTERIFYGKIAAEMIKEKPLFGVGIGNFTAALPEFLGPDAVIPSKSYPAWIVQPVHNIYLLLSAETGLLGLALFLGFLTVVLLELFRSRTGFIVHRLSFIVFLLIAGMSDHFLLTLHQGSLLLWVVFGLFGPHSSTDRVQASGA